MADFRVNLKLRAVLPIAGVLLAGILVFVWITLSLSEGAERQNVILVALAASQKHAGKCSLIVK